jgi:hypothetical protein
MLASPIAAAHVWSLEQIVKEALATYPAINARLASSSSKEVYLRK